MWSSVQQGGLIGWNTKPRKWRVRARQSESKYHHWHHKSNLLFFFWSLAPSHNPHIEVGHSQKNYCYYIAGWITCMLKVKEQKIIKLQKETVVTRCIPQVLIIHNLFWLLQLLFGKSRTRQHIKNARTYLKHKERMKI